MQRSNFLLVFGGRKNPTEYHQALILFLDLSNPQLGWKSHPRAEIHSPEKSINGNLIKGLSLRPLRCDLMYITTDHLKVCKDNFVWEVTSLAVSAASTVKKFVPLGVNDLAPCAN